MTNNHNCPIFIYFCHQKRTFFSLFCCFSRELKLLAVFRRYVKGVSMRNAGRRLILVAFALVLSCSALVDAAKTKKQINILGSLGIATSDIEEPLVDLGVELQMVQGLFLRLEVNTHLGTNDYYYGNYYDYGYYGGYYPGLGLNDGTILHGLTASSVYKVRLAKKLRFFIQAGVNYMFYQRDEYDNVYFTWRRIKKNGPGVAFGSGFELALSGKIGFSGGGIYRKLFKEEAQWHPDIPAPGQPTWLTIYVGLYYKVR
jgi:hypothetical protein